MHFSFILLGGLGYLATSVLTKEFYIVGANQQTCPCATGGSCQCVDAANTAIVPVDDFNCDSLIDKYLVPGDGPLSCNQDPDDWSADVKGCRFGDSTSAVDFVRAKGDDGFYNFRIRDTDGINPEWVVANCYGPDSCEAGDVNSGVRWDSKLCVSGIGSQTIVDAVYKCYDNKADEHVCP